MISNITTGNQGFSQQDFKARPFFLSHYRDYEKEKERGFGRMQDGRQNLVAAAYTQPFSVMGGVSAAGYLGYQKYRHDNFTKHLSVDNAFSRIRELENRLPLFKIPLRGTQIGDLLSIFASDKALKTVYAGHELLDGKELKEQFQFLRKGYKGNLDEDLLKGNYRFSFQKKGRVFGDVVLENLTDPQNPTVAHRISDVFQMQRPSTKGGALTALYDPGKRPVSFFGKIQDGAFSMRLLKSLGASESVLKKWQYGGAVFKDSMYELFFEGVRGMNRFLKEPVPVLDRIMAWEKHDAFGLTKVSKVADSWKEGGAIGKGFEQVFKSLGNTPVHEPVPWGRLPSFMRPYVREGAMTKTPLRLMAGIAGKGAIYVKGLPALYGGMDYFREQMSGFDPVTRAGVFGGIGMGIGSVIKSNAITKGPLAGVLTRTQGWGMGLGMAVGALPVFNRGITAGIGGTYSSARIWSARFWDSVGGHDAVQRQEALFPGLTNPFTGIGMAIAGGFVGYFNAEIGTARSFNPFQKTPEGWKQLVQEGLTAFSQVDTNKAVQLPGDFMERLLNYHVNDQKGIIRGTAEASAVLQGKLKPSEVMTPTGLMAALIGEGKGKEVFATSMPEEFFQRSATVEGAEVAATNIQRQLVTMHEAHAAQKRLLRDSGKGLLGRLFGAASDAVSGPMGFTRGAIKGGLAFAGIAQVGALVAGIGGGNLSPAGLLPGWLIRATGGGSSAHETEAIFTGRQEVAIRKARWWSLGSCLLPTTTLVISTFGDRLPASEIKEGQPILASDGSMAVVEEVWTREHDGYAYDLFTDDYEVPMSLTGNHMVWARLSLEVDPWFLAVEDLREGDWVLAPRLDSSNDRWITIRCIEKRFYSGPVYDFKTSASDSLLIGNFAIHNSPWEGTKVQYHRAHRAVLMQSDAEDNAIYGSKEEKIAYDPILHPLKALFDDEFKYHRDMRLSEVSPSPLSSRMFADVPLLGDVMASTIGEFIKPTRAIRPMEWMQRDAKNLASMMGAQNVISPPGFGSFGDMGHAPPVAELGGDTQFKAIDPNKMDFVFGSMWKKATEQAGLRGFMANAFLENFGYKDRSYDPVIERGESLLGAGHKFWSLNLGDPFGTTEALRRYMTRDRNNYYNPLRNLQPSWMPGSDYFTDFQHGNVFRKVQEGAILLPGRGYETLNPELQGMHPENYSVGHRYKILSNVAYGSNEYIQAKQRAVEAVQSGRASKRDMEVIAQANKQSEAKRLKRAFRGYQFQDQGTTDLELTITGVTEDGRFTAAEMGATPLKLAGVNTTMAAFVREELARTNVGTIAEAERRAREKQAEAFAAMKGTLEVGKKIRVTVSSSGAERHGRKETEVYIKGLNEKIKGMGAEVDQDSNFSTSVQYNAMQRMFGSAWEQYTHKWADMPFTPAMVLNRIAPFQPDKKFIQRLTPTELYAQTRVYGPEIQMWQNYKQSFLDPFLHQTTAKIFGDFVPKQVQYNRAMVEYFDKLKWYKYHITEQAAIEAGRGEIAQIYAQKKRQTMFGADPYRGYLDIYRALPGTERDFYREFVNETNEKEREKILTLVPEYMKHLYIAQWQNQDIKALANRVEAGIASGEERKELRRLYNLRSVEGMNFNNELDQQYKNEARGSDLTYADWARTKELRQYFQTFKMPKGNFVGWDPRVDLEDVKLKLAKQEGVNIHDIGLWDSQDASISRKPYIGDAVSDISDWMQGEEMHAGEFEGNMRRHIRQLTSRLDTVPLPPGMESRVVVSAHDTREHEVRREIRGRGII